MKDFDAVLAAIEGELPPSKAWDLLHCAQSIEYAVSGYPKLKPAIIRGTIGKLVKRKFLGAGAMSHDVTAPVAGAPDLDRATTLDAARTRLRAAIAAFRAHGGDYAPHLVYGACTRDEYERLQSMHVADHLESR